MTMTAVTQTHLAGWLAQRLAKGNLEADFLAALERQDVFLAAIAKPKQDATQSTIKVPIDYVTPQGISADYSTAFAQVGPALLGTAFEVGLKDCSGVVRWSDRTVREAMNRNPKTFGADPIVVALDRMRENMMIEFAFQVYRNGTGLRSVVSAVQAAQSSFDYFFLPNEADIRFYSVGMEVSFYQSNWTPRAHPASGRIEKVNKGTINGTTGSYIALAATGSFDVVAGDYITRKGNACSADTTTGHKDLTGLMAWVPPTAPGATAFWGIDRTVSYMLGGLRQETAGASYEDSVRQGVNYCINMGGRPDMVIMNGADFETLTGGFEGRKQFQETTIKPRGILEGKYTTGKDDVTVGFHGVQIVTPYGSVGVYPSAFCPKGYFFCLTSSDWELYSVGKIGDFIGDPNDKKIIHWDMTNNEYVAKAQWYANLVCNNLQRQLIGVL